MSIKTLKTSFVILLGFFVLSGCGALNIPDTALDIPDTKGVQSSQHSISDTRNGLTVTVDLIQDEERLKKHFGMDLSKKAILPVHIKIVNGSESSYLILNDTASILVKAHHRRHQKTGQGDALTGERVDAADDYVAALILTGPLFAAFKDSGGGKERAVRHSIFAKRLKSDMLSPGEERSGFLYFKAPRTEDTHKVFTLNFHSLTTKKTNEFIFTDIR